MLVYCYPIVNKELSVFFVLKKNFLYTGSSPQLGLAIVFAVVGVVVVLVMEWASGKKSGK